MIVELAPGKESMSQLEAIRDLRKQVKALVHANDDTVAFARTCLDFGASGYVSNKTQWPTFLEGIRHVLQGKVFSVHCLTDGEVKKPGMDTMIAMGIKLTPRERQVLNHIGRGLTTRQIAAELNLSVHTIDTYRGRIKKKLEISNSAELAIYAVRWVDAER